MFIIYYKVLLIIFNLVVGLFIVIVLYVVDFWETGFGFFDKVVVSLLF